MVILSCLKLFGNMFQNTISSHKPVQEFASKQGILSAGLDWFVWKYWEHALIRKLMKFGYADILIWSDHTRSGPKRVWYGNINDDLIFEFNPWTVLQQKYYISTLFLIWPTQLSLWKFSWSDSCLKIVQVANVFIIYLWVLTFPW